MAPVRGTWLWGSVVCVLAFACVARAEGQAAPNRKEAGAHYQRAVGLFKEGDYGAALAEFRAAYDAAPSFEVLYNLGLTERRLFKYGQAVKTLNRYLEEGGKKVPKDRRESVESELQQIRALTSTVTVTVEGKAARLSVDGELVGTTPLAEPVLLGPGKHVFKAERDGEAPDEQSVDLISGSARSVSLSPRAKPQENHEPVQVTLETTPPEAVLTIDGKLGGLSPTKVNLAPGTHEVIAELDGYQPARTDVVVTAGQPRTVKLTLLQAGAAASGGGGGGRHVSLVPGVVLLGGGAVATAVGVIFALQAQAAARQVSDFSKQGGAWSATWAATEATGQRNQTLAFVLLGTGAAALTAGIVATIISLASGSSSADEGEATWLLTPDLRGGATVSWHVRF
jgi:hypothetical protein